MASKLGALNKAIREAKELAKLGGLDKKAAAYLKRLTERVKEAKTPQGKKLAKEKLMQKKGEALANAGYKSAVENAPDPRMRSNRPAADQLGGSNRKMGGKVTKRPMGGKVYKNTVEKNMGGKVTKRPMGGKVYKNMGGKVTKRPMGGKVYKVDNAGQMMVQKMYGGKLGF